jgi:ABC-type branched-subunit amino acid transport system substrate-binding protein
MRNALQTIASCMALACAAMALVPASAGAQARGPFAGKILIGDLTQRTGAGGGSIMTDSTSHAVETTVRAINAAGGVKVKGKSYELAYKGIDTRGEPAATLAAAKEIIADGATAVLLPSFATEVAYRALSDARIISFGAAPRVTNPLMIEGPQKHPYLFGTVELAQPVISGWLGGIKQQFPNARRIAALNYTDPGGKFMTTTDFSGPLTTLKGKNPDIIYIGTQAQVLSATRQAVQLKAGSVLWNYTMRPVDLKQIGPLGSSSLVLADFRAPFTEGLTPPEFLKAATLFGRMKSGEPAQVGIAAAYYDFIQLLARAIEKAGTVDDNTAIAKALEGTSYEGSFGRAQILPNHTLRGPIGLIIADSSNVSIHVYKDVESSTTPAISSIKVKNGWSQ